MNQKINDLDIPEEKLRSLARTLLPIIRKYLMSDEGKKDYEEWQRQKQLNNDENLIENPVDKS